MKRKELFFLLAVLAVFGGFELYAAFTAAQTTPAAITFGVPIISFTKALPSNNPVVQMTYTMAQPGALLVGCSMDTFTPTDEKAVYINGQLADKLADLIGLNKKTSTALWYLPNVPAGPATIEGTSTTGATHGYGQECTAQAVYGANPTNPIEWMYTVNTPALGSGGTITASCNFSVANPTDAFLTFEYSTAYNTKSVVTETPFGTSLVTSQFSGLQMAFAQSAHLTPGVDYKQTWSAIGSTTDVQYSIITAVFRQ